MVLVLVVEHWSSSIASAGGLRVHGSLASRSTRVLLIRGPQDIV